MFQYCCLNPIAEVGLAKFKDNYKKTYTVTDYSIGAIQKLAQNHLSEFLLSDLKHIGVSNQECKNS